MISPATEDEDLYLRVSPLTRSSPWSDPQATPDGLVCRMARAAPVTEGSRPSTPPRILVIATYDTEPPGKAPEAEAWWVYPTQALVRDLEKQGVYYDVLWTEVDSDSQGGKMRLPEAIFWSSPWCEAMYKRYPWVLQMDNTYNTNRKRMYVPASSLLTHQSPIFSSISVAMQLPAYETIIKTSFRLNDSRAKRLHANS